VNELYEFHEILGEGAFSKCYRAKFLPTNEIIAVKITRNERQTDIILNLVKQEAEILNQFDHPNIVKVKHLIQINDQLYMGMELIECGSLKSFLEKRKLNN